MGTPIISGDIPEAQIQLPDLNKGEQKVSCLRTHQTPHKLRAVAASLRAFS